MMPKLLAIAGGTASGKTTIVKEFMDFLGERGQLIGVDSYYHSFSELSFEERTKKNYDHPSSIDMDLLYSDLLALKGGQTVEVPVYDYVNYTRSSKTHLVEPRDLIIVEGLFALYDARVRELFDLSVYVQADADERLIRRIIRDRKTRGRSLESIIDQYEKTVKPMHEAFISPTKKYANIILPGGAQNRKGVELLKSYLISAIKEDS
ncbi:MAG: uridine kinase [Tissierellia bacterium]|nr:uridine kinase [Tissierellia bacterium]